MYFALLYLLLQQLQRLLIVLPISLIKSLRFGSQSALLFAFLRGVYFREHQSRVFRERGVVSQKQIYLVHPFVFPPFPVTSLSFVYLHSRRRDPLSCISWKPLRVYASIQLCWQFDLPVVQYYSVFFLGLMLIIQYLKVDLVLFLPAFSEGLCLNGFVYSA